MLNLKNKFKKVIISKNKLLQIFATFLKNFLITKNFKIPYILAIKNITKLHLLNVF